MLFEHEHRLTYLRMIHKNFMIFFYNYQFLGLITLSKTFVSSSKS